MKAFGSASRVLSALLLLLLANVSFSTSNFFPDTIPLPAGFRPEGIVRGYGTTFYVGSLADGSIYQGDLRTGAGSILVTGPGTPAVGLAFDRRTGYLFVSGGPSGMARVYDGGTGAFISEYALVGSGFINDAIVTRDAAYFTDSFQAVLYRLPLSQSGGLPDPYDVETLPLTGDFVLIPGFNTNGIEALPSGESLIIVHSTLGVLYNVDTATGYATLIDLGGGAVSNGDGLLLAGSKLYVVQNQLNQIAVVQLNNDSTAGAIVATITDSDFDIPTTITEFGNSLYAVNARFSTPPGPATEYDVIRVLRD